LSILQYKTQKQIYYSQERLFLIFFCFDWLTVNYSPLWMSIVKIERRKKNSIIKIPPIESYQTFSSDDGLFFCCCHKSNFKHHFINYIYSQRESSLTLSSDILASLIFPIIENSRSVCCFFSTKMKFFCSILYSMTH
jgi:hypothetical protein